MAKKSFHIFCCPYAIGNWHFAVIFTKGARYACMNIKNMYYSTPMDKYEYMRIQFSEIPSEIVEQYELEKLQHEGWV